MEKQDLISIQLLCSHYNVPASFLDKLFDYELIEIQAIENDLFISKTQIRDVEKIMRLHFDLDINIEGVDAIYNLLKQVKTLKEEVIVLNNKLKLYE
jgi:hypothetical protein